MPTRSIALRLDLSDASHREALWTTHALVNEKARWFLEQLLILRGDDVWTTDAALARALGHPGVGMNDHDLFDVTAAMVQERRRELVRLLNPGVHGAELEKAAAEMGTLYDLVVPSHTAGEEGDAQQANRFMGILVDPESEGGLSALAKAKAPEWVEQKRADVPRWEEAAEAWRTDALCGSQPTGRQPVWRDLAKKGEPAWIEAFLKDLEKNQKKAGEGGESALLSRLKLTGLLPVWNRYQTIKAMLGDTGRGFLSKWDRLAFKLAVSRLLSWESWNHRARKEHAARQEAFQAAEAALVPYSSMKSLLCSYEKERTSELQATNPLSRDAKEDTQFHLTGRQIRKWEALARELRKAGGNADPHQVAADFQTANPKDSPDPYFTEWVLASPSRSPLWQTDDGVKAVQLLARANRLESKTRKSRERTAMTPPDARLHPIWLQFEEPSGSNLKSLDLIQLPEGGWVASLDLIQRGQDGTYEECPFRIPIRPSPQLALQKLDKLNKKGGGPGKTPVLTFVQAPSHVRVDDRSAFETWTGTMQSPDILLDRGHLETNPHGPLDTTQLKAYLKLVLDLAPQLVEGQGILKGDRWSDAPKWGYHLQSSLAEPGKHEDALAEGQRFLSVDLGVRDLAAVALFEVRKGEVHKDEKAFPIPASTLWKAVLVEGSVATLSLPGELSTGNKVADARRREAAEALRLLKLLKARRTRLLALAHPQAAAFSRIKAIEGLQRKPKDPFAHARAAEDLNRHAKALLALLANDDPPRAKGDRASGKKQETRASNVDPRHHGALRQAAGLSELPEELDKIPVARATLETWDEAITELIRVWRDRTRRRDPRKVELHGKSLWAVEHLSDVRDFLKGWHRRGQESGEINRPGRDFAKNLLDHINQLKEDRTKEGANLLVNTARGLRYDSTICRWVKAFEPAHLILFEDLARYRFFTDRPRAENSQLMRWSHRELTKVAKEMAQLFGIGVLDTGAAFSSKYHGWSGAPGVRCATFTAEEIGSDWFQRRWKEAGHDWQPIPNLPVPWEGGKVFHTLDKEGRLVSLDADHNAAISLARRFAMRNSEAIRLVCTSKGSHFVPDALGKRLLGGLRDTTNPKDKGYGQLVAAHGQSVFNWESLTQSEWERLSGKKVAKQDEEGSEVDDDAEVQEEALEAAEAESGRVEDAVAGKKVIFFRDPSGVFFPAQDWLPAEAFWGTVKRRIAAALGRMHEANRPF